MTEKNKNILETFLENKVEFKKLDTYQPTIIADETKKIIDLEPYLEKPLSIKYTHEFDDIRGFVDYIEKYKTKSTVCFAGRSKLIVYIDFHTKDTPAWARHNITYNINRSSRWSLWERKHNQWLSQRDFSDFLDTGLNEITEPKQSEILNLVKNFRATVNQEVDYEDVSGGTNFKFSKKVKSGNTKKENVTLPEQLIITLQPFDNLELLNPRIKDKDKKIPAYKLRAKINWRINTNHSDEQAIEFKIQIINFENAVEETLESIRMAISELTGITTYIG